MGLKLDFVQLGPHLNQISAQMRSLIKPPFKHYIFNWAPSRTHLICCKCGPTGAWLKPHLAESLNVSGAHAGPDWNPFWDSPTWTEVEPGDTSSRAQSLCPIRTQFKVHVGPAWGLTSFSTLGEKTNIGKDQQEYIGHILRIVGLKISSKII